MSQQTAQGGIGGAVDQTRERHSPSARCYERWADADLLIEAMAVVDTAEANRSFPPVLRQYPVAEQADPLLTQLLH